MEMHVSYRCPNESDFSKIAKFPMLQQRYLESSRHYQKLMLNESNYNGPEILDNMTVVNGCYKILQIKNFGEIKCREKNLLVSSRARLL